MYRLLKEGCFIWNVSHIGKRQLGGRQITLGGFPFSSAQEITDHIEKIKPCDVDGSLCLTDSFFLMQLAMWDTVPSEEVSEHHSSDREEMLMTCDHGQVICDKLSLLGVVP